MLFARINEVSQDYVAEFYISAYFFVCKHFPSTLYIHDHGNFVWIHDVHIALESFPVQELEILTLFWLFSTRFDHCYYFNLEYID